MLSDPSLLAAAAGASGGPNLWGALGCSVAYAGALFASLDAIGDYVQFRSSVPVLGLGHRLKYSAKLFGSGITVVSAGSVLALDDNWFAFAVLSVAFLAIIAGSVLAARLAVRRLAPSAAAATAPTAPPVTSPPPARSPAALSGTGSVVGH